MSHAVLRVAQVQAIRITQADRVKLGVHQAVLVLVESDRPMKDNKEVADIVAGPAGGNASSS
jgi:hypothetical protein